MSAEKHPAAGIEVEVPDDIDQVKRITRRQYRIEWLQGNVRPILL